jgi:hypothetical protein
VVSEHHKTEVVGVARTGRADSFAARLAAEGRPPSAAAGDAVPWDLVASAMPLASSSWAVRPSP